MRVPPWSKFRVEAKVFVADIMTTNPATNAIDNHQFAMVSEIQLKSVTVPLIRSKGADFNSCFTEFVDIRIWQSAAADFVLKHVNPHTCPRPFYERLLNAPAEAIVMKHVELK